eukprot:TRINITY_DN90228_c0_g1_i1.p1 TRINITY_DN90228_c0_g1~~TRINITY_DN90228_c0_g1_i1.p1  ORF type:complete len:341 (+),score=78.65 TRINITY_DN90228_c0_g1_i1:88-1110(+)
MKLVLSVLLMCLSAPLALVQEPGGQENLAADDAAVVVSGNASDGAPPKLSWQTLQDLQGASATEQQKQLVSLAKTVLGSVQCHDCAKVTPPRKEITAVLSMQALMHAIPGDFVETGVYTGGTSVVMAKVLTAFDKMDRKLWAADSFKGLPKNDSKALENAHEQVKSHGADTLDGSAVSAKRGREGEYQAPRKTFEDNLNRNGFDHDRVKILEGWFNETLPKAPIQKISFLRLDGDIFVSTWDSLTALYDKVSKGGYVYVDDYGSYAGCQAAVDKYRAEKGIKEEMTPVYEDNGKKYEAVWWRKGVAKEALDERSIKQAVEMLPGSAKLMRREVDESHAAI